MTLVGPHRDDLVIELDGRDSGASARVPAAGDALALRLAERGPVAEAVGSPPILLLDDALSELDQRVRARVLAHVVKAGQVFLTTCRSQIGESARPTWWERCDAAA